MVIIDISNNSNNDNANNKKMTIIIPKVIIGISIHPTSE